MTKKIESVAKDIRELLVGVKTGSHEVKFDSPEFLGKFGVSTAKAFKKSLSYENKIRPANTFYASEIGSKCYRQLWYKYHMPLRAEPVSASMSMKYLYGGIVEEVVLRLAELSGHKVEYEQESVTDTVLLPHLRTHLEIRGRIDAIVDGVVVDVKSTSSYGFKDFQQGSGHEKFGYREQLEFYKWQMYNKGLAHKDKAGFIAVDKQLGHIEYCPLPETDHFSWFKIWDGLGAIVTSEKTPPHERLPTVLEGSNQKLGVECSYCAYKQECWKDANGGKGLRAFGYSGKVVWLTEVKKEPRVPEITDKIVTGGDSNE